MTEPIAKTQLKAAELEAAILKRLSEHPDCAGISYVYVKATGLKPLEETWKHIMVSRHPATPDTTGNESNARRIGHDAPRV
jgi:hypothetical protein